jgi:hypothetical protein
MEKFEIKTLPNPIFFEKEVSLWILMELAEENRKIEISKRRSDGVCERKTFTIPLNDFDYDKSSFTIGGKQMAKFYFHFRKDDSENFDLLYDVSTFGEYRISGNLNIDEASLISIIKSKIIQELKDKDISSWGESLNKMLKIGAEEWEKYKTHVIENIKIFVALQDAGELPEKDISNWKESDIEEDLKLFDNKLKDVVFSREDKSINELEDKKQEKCLNI